MAWFNQKMERWTFLLALLAVVGLFSLMSTHYVGPLTKTVSAYSLDQSASPENDAVDFADEIEVGVPDLIVKCARPIPVVQIKKSSSDDSSNFVIYRPRPFSQGPPSDVVA